MPLRGVEPPHLPMRMNAFSGWDGCQRFEARKWGEQEKQNELAEVEAGLNQQRIEVTDEALAYLADHMREELKKGQPEQVIPIIRSAVRKVEMGMDRLTIHHIPPLLGVPGEKFGLEEWRIRASNP